jgi:hypothetical protein
MDLSLLYHSIPESVFVLCHLVEKVGQDNKMRILLNRARLFHSPVIEHFSRPLSTERRKQTKFPKHCDAMKPRQNSVKRNNERNVFK